jgi:Lon-like protease
MTSVITANDIVPPGEPPPVRPRGRVRPWHLVAAFAIVASVLAANTITVPYFAIAPGSAVAVGPLVTVQDGPSYPAEGTIYLTTVSLRRVTMFEAIQGWIDPAIDVVEERVILPPQVSRSELREFNLELMDTSKEQALGVAFEKLDFDAIQGDGAEVVQVLPDTPADGVLEPGDAIVAVDGKDIGVHIEAVRLIGDRRPGDEVRLRIEPQGGGEARDLTVRLAASPTDPERALLGVTLRTRDLRFDFPYEVDIASERIGGPSAGLAFTLQVLDVLTDGELTGGLRVAATGTIELDGSVGAVGGVAQKTVAVRDAGIDLFLVPASEVEQARRHAGQALQIAPVRDLDDALRVLASLGGNGLALDGPGDEGA